MKRAQQLGSLLFLSGIILFGIMHVAIAFHSPQFPGDFIATLTQVMGWVPYLLSIVFMLTGLFILLNGILDERLEKEDRKKKSEQW